MSSGVDPLHVLVLGTNVGTTDMVRYFQSQGHFVTVTDNIPGAKGAKAIADAVESVSTADINGLVRLCEERQVDRVTAGVSEFNLRSAIAVNEQRGQPFYCTSAQWDQFMDKAEFRALCQLYEIPVPVTYFRGGRKEYDQRSGPIPVPCIVKPVDANSLSGITICDDQESLGSAVDEAFQKSRRGSIIIEEFVEGDEFTAAYVMVDGEASLSSLDVRIPYAFEGMTTTFPIIRVYPPDFAEAYREVCDPHVRSMLERSGLRDCCVFVQGIRRGSAFAVFEAGLRMAGEAPYRFLDEVNGVSPLRHFADTSIGQRSSYDIRRDDVHLGGSLCAVASFVLRGGQIASMSDVAQTAERMPEVLEWEQRYEPGDNVPHGTTLRQIGIRFIIRCRDVLHLRGTLGQLCAEVDVFGIDGQSLAIKPEPSLLEIS